MVYVVAFAGYITFAIVIALGWRTCESANPKPPTPR